jgi:hypothetical protein
MLTHKFVSPKLDGPDPAKLRPSNWNDDHVFTGGNIGSILLRDTAAAYGGSWLDASVGVLFAAGAAQKPVYTQSLALSDLSLSTPLPGPSGGTGFGTFAIGDLLYASATNALSKLAVVTAGSVLVSGATPAWSAAPSVTSIALGAGTPSAPSVWLGADTGTGWYRDAANHWTFVSGGGNKISLMNGLMRLEGTMVLGWATNDSTTAADATVVREGVGTLAQRSGTTTQVYSLYNTFTDASNYERLTFSHPAANQFRITPDSLGTGATSHLSLNAQTGRSVIMAVAGSTIFQFDSTGMLAGVNNTKDIGSGAAAPRSVYAATSVLSADGSGGTPSFAFTSDANTGFYRVSAGIAGYTSNGAPSMQFKSSGVLSLLSNTGELRWGSSEDVRLVWEAANGLALRNGANVQTFNIYESFTDASNYRRLSINTINASTYDITTQSAGSGGTGAILGLGSNNARKWNIDGSGHLYPQTDAAPDLGKSNQRVRNIFVSSSVVNKTKAGTPTDSDVTNPADGMLIVDTTANKIWVRTGGAWKGVLVA